MIKEYEINDILKVRYIVVYTLKLMLKSTNNQKLNIEKVWIKLKVPC